jgi:hypothetical protein
MEKRILKNSSYTYEGVPIKWQDKDLPQNSYTISLTATWKKLSTA